jgi:hypothetical protein
MGDVRGERLVATRSPQNLQRALPGEMWTRCITNSMSGSLFARQAHSSACVVGKWLSKTGTDRKSLRRHTLPIRSLNRDGPLDGSIKAGRR